MQLSQLTTEVEISIWFRQADSGYLDITGYAESRRPVGSSRLEARQMFSQSLSWGLVMRLGGPFPIFVQRTT